MDVSSEVNVLRHHLVYLREFGYRGDCLNQSHLQWAMRVGAASWQYHDLLNWLEDAFYENGHHSEISEAEHLLRLLRNSYMMIRNDGNQISNPLIFRSAATLKLVKVLFKIFLRKEEADENNKKNKNEYSEAVYHVNNDFTPHVDFSTAKNWWNR